MSATSVPPTRAAADGADSSSSSSGDAAAAPAAAPTPFRRAATLPASSGFSFVRSPRHCGGAGGSGASSYTHGTPPAAGGGSASFLLQSPAAWLPPHGSRHTVDQLLRMMMAFTIMQGGAPGDTGECARRKVGAGARCLALASWRGPGRPAAA
jgi:hypothetical protein